MDDYKGQERRVSDDLAKTHRRVTERHTSEIAATQAQISGLAVGMKNVDKNINALIAKVDQSARPKDKNWAAIGSLIVTIIIVFGGIYGFLFKTQAKRTDDALMGVQRESDMRHIVIEDHAAALAITVARLQDVLFEKLTRQEDLNMQFIRAAEMVQLQERVIKKLERQDDINLEMIKGITKTGDK